MKMSEYKKSADADFEVGKGAGNGLARKILERGLEDRLHYG